MKYFILNIGSLSKNIKSKKTKNLKLKRNIKIKDLYLGSWCFVDNYLKKNYEVVNYHWDDRVKLKKDYLYIQGIYEKYLVSLSKLLNNYHNTKYSTKFWRFILGYWLHTYLATVFDRWENIDSCLKNYSNIKEAKVLNFKKKVIGSNTNEFFALISHEHWNQSLYYDILIFLKKKKKIKFLINNHNFNDSDLIYKGYKINFKTKLANKIKQIYNFVFKFFLVKNKYIFHKLKIGLINNFLLHIKFFQLPNTFEKFSSKNQINLKARKKLKISMHCKNLLEFFLIENLFNHIPKDFLEDFDEIKNYINKKNYPKKPLKIVSVNSLLSDNVFMRYMADQQENNNCKIILGQHGGAYGHFDFIWAEEHEIKISDQFLSWGWRNDSKVNPFGYLQNNFINRKNNFVENSKIIKCCYYIRSRPKFTFRLDSSIGSNQMSKYFQNCLNFFKQYPDKKFVQNIYPRFHSSNFQWMHKQIWSREMPNLKLTDTDTESFKTTLKKYDLLIFSYIATGFMECLINDKPFVLISSLKECPIRKEAINDFKMLKDAKIFFEDNVSAYNHIQSIRNQPYRWWNSSRVKIAKLNFIKKYISISMNNEKITKFYKLMREN